MREPAWLPLVEVPAGAGHDEQDEQDLDGASGEEPLARGFVESGGHVQAIVSGGAGRDRMRYLRYAARPMP